MEDLKKLKIFINVYFKNIISAKDITLLLKYIKQLYVKVSNKYERWNDLRGFIVFCNENLNSFINYNMNANKKNTILKNIYLYIAYINQFGNNALINFMEIHTDTIGDTWKHKKNLNISYMLHELNDNMKTYRYAVSGFLLI